MLTSTPPSGRRRSCLDECPCAVQHTVHVHVYQVREHPGIDIGDHADRIDDACVVDPEIDPPETFSNYRPEGLEIRGIPDVGGVGDYMMPVGTWRWLWAFPCADPDPHSELGESRRPSRHRFRGWRP